MLHANPIRSWPRVTAAFLFMAGSTLACGKTQDAGETGLLSPPPSLISTVIAPVETVPIATAIAPVETAPMATAIAPVETAPIAAADPPAAVQPAKLPSEPTAPRAPPPDAAQLRKLAEAPCRCTDTECLVQTASHFREAFGALVAVSDGVDPATQRVVLRFDQCIEKFEAKYLGEKAGEEGPASTSTHSPRKAREPAQARRAGSR